MTSDRVKKSEKPSYIAEQFKELQQLREQVRKAELNFSPKRNPRAAVDPKGDNEGRGLKAKVN